MKVYLVIVCSFLTVNIAVGQKHSVSINYKPSLTYFGKQTQSFQDHYFKSRKGTATFNSAINVLYSYKVSPKIGLTAALEYACQGQDIKFNADSVYPGTKTLTLKTKLNYLRIPVTVSYAIFKKKTSTLSIYSGISLGLAVKRTDNYQKVILERVLLPSAEKRYNKRDWAIPIGLSYNKQWTTKVFTNFGIEYLLGLTEAFSKNNGSKFGVLSQFDNSRQKRLALNIGVGFHLTK